MEARGIPYVATANASYPLDLYEKAGKVRTIRVTRLIHVFSPCPPRWSFPFNSTINIGKLAVETGWVILYEVEDSVFHLTSASESIAKQDNLRPLREYLVEQGRFKNLTEEQIEALQRWVNARRKCCLDRAGD